MKRNESRLALVTLTAIVAMGMLALAGCAKVPVERIGTQPAISPGGTLIALEAGPINKKDGKVEPQWVNDHVMYVVKATSEPGEAIKLPDSNAPTAMAWRTTPAGAALTFATYPYGAQAGTLHSVLVPGPEQLPLPATEPAPQSAPASPTITFEAPATEQTPAAMTAPAPEAVTAPAPEAAPEAAPASEPADSGALPAPANVIAPLTASIEIETIPTTVSTPIPATEPALVPAPAIVLGTPVALPEGLKAIGMAWNTSGNVLALAMENPKLKCITLMLFDGQTFLDTGIQLSTGKFVWLCDTILYAQRGLEKKKNQQIIEIKLQQGAPVCVNRVYAIGKDLQLVGLLDSKLVWVRNKQVYQADRPFYGSSEKIANIYSDTPVVALSAKDRIRVVDSRPNFRSDRALEKGSILFGASAGHVYVLKDRGAIQRYTYSLTSPYTSDRDAVTTVFELCPIGLRP